MSELWFFSILLSSWYGLSLIVFITLQFLSAPYGRHIRSGWGPVIPSVWGWVFMELPAVIVPIVCCVISERITQSFSLFCLALWQIHYIHRTFIYPFRMRLQGKRMPLLIAITAWVTNLGINYLIFRDLFTFGEQKTGSWWLETHVIIGVLLFASGFYVNRSSDATLRKLRQPGELGYHIPNGGMYRWVSCPNYLGELIQWAGWACLCWNLSALAFWVWSLSNLLPRALKHHQWYHEHFDDYPSQRKAIIPLLI